MLDEHVLGRRGAALHAVDDHHIGAGLHGERHVVFRAGGADLHIDRLLPIGDLADLLDLDGEIVGTGPVGMAAGAALIDAHGQVAHLGNALGDLLAQQHAAAAGLRALPDHHLDRIGAAQIVGVQAVAGGQHLIDQRLRGLALLLGHAAVAGGGAGAHGGRGAADGLLGVGAKRAEAHAGDGDRDLELDRLLGEARAQRHIGGAFLAIAFQGIARDGGAEEDEIVEGGQLALGAVAADFIEALIGGAVDLRQDMGRKAVRRTQAPGIDGHLWLLLDPRR